MMRKSLVALAASLMTLGAISSTVAIMMTGGGAVQVA